MGVLAQVVLPFKTNIPKDVAVNTFAIGGMSESSSTADENTLIAAITGLYNGTTGQVLPVAAYIGNQVSRVANMCQIKLYDISGHLDGSPHGSPFRTATFTLAGAQSTTTHPDEVALAVTLEAANRADQRIETVDGADPNLLRDRPRQRYTGRYYLGPLEQMSTVAQDANSFARPIAQFTSDVRIATAEFVEAVKTLIPGAFVGVWSRADEAIREVDAVSTDNAFDTQRRRGVQPTARLRLAVTGAGQQVELAA